MPRTAPLRADASLHDAAAPDPWAESLRQHLLRWPLDLLAGPEAEPPAVKPPPQLTPAERQRLQREHDVVTWILILGTVVFMGFLVAAGQGWLS